MQVGDRVKCMYGTGIVKELGKPNGIVVVVMDNWELTGGQRPTAFLNINGLQVVAKVGDIVTSMYGTGEIVNILSNGSVAVKMHHWEMTGGQNPIAYLNSESFTKVSADIGDIVTSMYGTGKVKGFQSNGSVAATMHHWEMTGGQNPTAYLNTESFTKVPADIGDNVTSMYGTGKVTGYRSNGSAAVNMHHWKMTGGQTPTAFLNSESFVKVVVDIGDTVTSMYGTGEVVGLKVNGCVVVKMKNWELTGGQKPIAYLNPESIL